MFIRKSITWKYAIAFVIMIMIPTFVIGVIVYSHYRDVLLEHYSQRVEQLLDQAALGIANNVKSMSLSLATIENERELKESLKNWYWSENIHDRYLYSQEIDQYLGKMSNYLTGDYVFVFYFKGGGFYYYGDAPVQNEETVKNSDWYYETISNRQKVKIIDSFDSISNENADKKYISAAISPKDSHAADDVELIYISGSINVMDIIDALSKEYETSEVMVLDNQNEIIFSQKKGEDEHAYYEVTSRINNLGDGNKTSTGAADNKEYMVTSSFISKTGWTIFYLVEINDAMAELNKISWVAITFLSIMLLLFTAFSVYFLQNIVIPIKKMMQTMKMVEVGNFDISLEVKGSDELSQLGNAFNTMVGKIQMLIVERNMKEKEKNKVEMEALQAEINPHFIANTLSTIRFMAMIANVDNIKDMTEAFINIVSSSFNRDSRLHTVEAEIKVLESYIHIMKVRYANKFDADIEADADIKSCYILKMVIQPIVENSITHGLVDMTGNGRVCVRFLNSGGSLLVEVEDNGVGVEEGRIQDLLHEDNGDRKGFTGIGIKNVDQRIKLNHGEIYGLSVSSVVNEYTLFQVKLPLIETFEEMEQVNME